MSNLLPPNANSHEHALDDATARIGSVPVEINKLWNAETIPAALLPWLAWALSVDEWDETWSEAQKRAMVAASFEVHSRKGTPFSIKSALQALGYDNVQIREGELYFYNGERIFDGSFLYGADGFWPLFDVVLNIGFVPDAPMIQLIRDRIERYKNARSQLRNLIFMDLLYDNTAIYDGTYNFNGGVL
jgi:phage tail P2-like protein